jgi:hypothetical protein
VETGVYAVVALGLWAAFVLLTTAHGSADEERYVAPLVALPVIAFGAALFNRQAWPLGTLVVGVLLALAVGALGPFAKNYPGYIEYLGRPVRLFWQELVLGQASKVLPGDDATRETLALVLVVLAAVAVSVLAAPWISTRVRALEARRALVAGAVLVPVLLVAAAGGVWTKTRFEDGLVAKRDLGELAWIDRATGGDRAFYWAYSVPGGELIPDVNAGLALLYNKSICCTAFPRRLVLEPQTKPEGNKLRGALPGEVVPYLVRPAGYLPLGFRSERVASHTEGPLTHHVERFLGESRPAVIVRGAEADGTVPARTPVALDVTRVGAPDRCVAAELTAPGSLAAPAAFTVTRGGAVVLRGRLRPGATRRVRLPADAGTRLLLRSAPRLGALRLGEIVVVDCARRA